MRYRAEGGDPILSCPPPLAGDQELGGHNNPLRRLQPHVLHTKTPPLPIRFLHWVGVLLMFNIHFYAIFKFREGRFQRFQEGEVDILVCTDICSRGLDTLRVNMCNMKPIYLMSYSIISLYPLKIGMKPLFKQNIVNLIVENEYLLLNTCFNVS